MNEQSSDKTIDATITADFAKELAPLGYPMGRQLSSTPGSPWCDGPECKSRFGPITVSCLKRLKLTQARVWVEFKQGYDVAKDTPKHHAYHHYLDRWSALSDQLLLNWRTNYLTLVEGTQTFSEAELFERSVAMLKHYKGRYPNIRWVEVENEPEDMVAHYRCYQFANKLVNAVNAGISDPQQYLEIGGPAINDFHRGNLCKFLDLYVADNSPEKRLDFISYHQYLFGSNTDPLANKDFPAKVADERSQLESLLTERSLKVHRPAFVTETGIFPGLRESHLGFDADLHIHAAGMAAMDFWYARQSGIVPFHWTITHPDNGRKAMFADAIEGVSRPFYHLAYLQTLLSGTVFHSTMSLNIRGLGLGSIATGTQTSVTLMTWNYQWTNKTAYEGQLVLKNLPPAFTQKNIRVERYLIPNNQHEGGLLKVEDRVYPPFKSGSYGIKPRHEPNEVRFIKLTVQDTWWSQIWSWIWSR